MTPRPPGAGFSLGVVILAAGASSRMGGPKLLLPWAGGTILSHLAVLWQRLGAEQIAVVCAESNQGLSEELERLAFPAENRIINPDPARGMFSSIQCAAQWNGWRAGISHFAITLGDQPHLRESTLPSVVGSARAEPRRIWQPSFEGRPRHPVILPRPHFLALGQIGEGTLKDFLAQRPAERAFLELDDPGLNLDLDYPADYQKALMLASTAT